MCRIPKSDRIKSRLWVLTHEVWDKQWKSRRVVWEDFPQGNQTVLRGVAPKDRLITRVNFCGIFSPENPQAFPLFVKLLGLRTKEDAEEGLAEKNSRGTV